MREKIKARKKESKARSARNHSNAFLSRVKLRKRRSLAYKAASQMSSHHLRLRAAPGMVGAEAFVVILCAERSLLAIAILCARQSAEAVHAGRRGGRTLGHIRRAARIAMAADDGADCRAGQH